MRAFENNCQTLQYQVFEDGEKAGFVQYRMAGNNMWVLHTSLFRCFKSSEIVEALLRYVLQDVQCSRISMVPFCPTMRVFLGMRPEYTALVSPAWRARSTSFDPTAYSADAAGPLDYVRFTGSRRAVLRAPEQASS